MHIIQNNPYRTVGLLVGATAREQERQVKRLKQFIEAEQEPQDDFSFPTLGDLHRTVESVLDAASKLSLNSDKMSAALFWFYDSKNALKTDEDAFKAIKEADLDQVINIWTRLTSNGEVSQRNASAYSNLGTLYLSGILEGTKTNEAIFEKGISLKLKFLESDYIKDFKALATDENFKTTKKELQLLFLNQVQSEVEKSGAITSNKFLDIITKQEFSAKEDFLKGFVQKPIEEIERKIEDTRKKQKVNPAKAGDYANDLYIESKPLINIVISLLSKSDPKSISISDKLANEILQCSIALFNHFHETDTEVGEIALDLNKKARSIALGSIVKERINDSTPIVEKYINNRPERQKIKQVKSELEFISSKLERFQILPDSVSNAKDLIDSCKPKLIKIKQLLGATDEFYINLSSSVVQNAQNMLVQAVNEKVEEFTNSILSRFGVSTSSIEGIITVALDTTFKLGTLDMNFLLKMNFNKNLEGIKSLANQIGISTLTPKEKLQNELKKAERELIEIQNTTFLQSAITLKQNELTAIRNKTFYSNEINIQIVKLNEIKKWQLFRSKSTREEEISQQEKIIQNIKNKGDNEKQKALELCQSELDKIKRNSEAEKVYKYSLQESLINDIKTKIQKAEY